jgi:hypothetical protein
MKCKRSPFEKSFFVRRLYAQYQYGSSISGLPLESDLRIFPILVLTLLTIAGFYDPEAILHSSHSNSSGSLVGRALKDPLSHRWWRLCRCADLQRCSRELQNSYRKIFFCDTRVKTTLLLRS